MIFVVSDKTLRGDEAVVSAGPLVTVFDKANGTFPLIFVLFLLFSSGDMGVTRGVTWMSPGLVTAMSLVSCNTTSLNKHFKAVER